jgi:hypothetical protein
MKSDRFIRDRQTFAMTCINALDEGDFLRQPTWYATRRPMGGPGNLPAIRLSIDAANTR